jgi:uncharacterized protein YlxW (UPF0749 family)
VPAVSADPQARPRRRVDGSMSLLVDITSASLDSAYADHAARTAGAPGDPAAAPAPRTPLRRTAGALLLVGLGLLTGTAIDQVRDRAAASTGVRAELATRVEAATVESDRLAAQAGQLRLDVARTREQALGAGVRGRAASDEVAAAALAAGLVPVTGPGIVVTLDDAKPDMTGTQTPELRGGRPGDLRLTDRELQSVVNALWSVGAEAMTVNGIRLTALTAIRSAGEAILVDFRPLSPPYEIQAIGDPKQLEFDFLDGRIGLRFAGLAAEQGFGFDVRRADELRLPSAGEPDLRSAVPAPAPGSSP